MSAAGATSLIDHATGCGCVERERHRRAKPGRTKKTLPAKQIVKFHRQLILIATCVFLAAAFARSLHLGGPARAYFGVDGMILLGVLRDLLVDRRKVPSAISSAFNCHMKLG
jgi:hypothetical protein